MEQEINLLCFAKTVSYGLEIYNYTLHGYIMLHHDGQRCIELPYATA